MTPKKNTARKASAPRHEILDGPRPRGRSRERRPREERHREDRSRDDHSRADHPRLFCHRERCPHGVRERNELPNDGEVQPDDEGIQIPHIQPPFVIPTVNARPGDNVELQTPYPAGPLENPPFADLAADAYAGGNPQFQAPYPAGQLEDVHENREEEEFMQFPMVQHGGPPAMLDAYSRIRDLDCHIRGPEEFVLPYFMGSRTFHLLPEEQKIIERITTVTANPAQRLDLLLRLDLSGVACDNDYLLRQHLPEYLTAVRSTQFKIIRGVLAGILLGGEWHTEPVVSLMFPISVMDNLVLRDINEAIISYKDPEELAVFRAAHEQMETDLTMPEGIPDSIRVAVCARHIYGPRSAIRINPNGQGGSNQGDW